MIHLCSTYERNNKDKCSHTLTLSKKQTCVILMRENNDAASKLNDSHIISDAKTPNVIH